MFNPNQPMVNQYFAMIKNAGYKYSKDELGYYFDNGLKRFSIMRTGPFVQAFYNKREDGNWKLQDKQTTTIQLYESLQWILQKIQSGV